MRRSKTSQFSAGFARVNLLWSCLQFGLFFLFVFQRRDRDLERNDTGYLDVVLHRDAGDSWQGQRCCSSSSLFGPVAGRQGIDRPGLTHAAWEQTRAARRAQLNCWCWKAANVSTARPLRWVFFSACLWLSKAAYVRLWVLGEIKQTAFKAF